jgi:hypothetical protein
MQNQKNTVGFETSDRQGLRRRWQFYESDRDPYLRLPEMDR